MPYDTSILDAALARRRAELEAKREETLAEALRLLAEIGPRFGVEEAYLFGSVVTPGRYVEDSDVDLAVILPGEQFFPFAAEYSARLGRDVDVIPLEQIHFADKIRREGIRWTP